jgi:hypothetical protein
LGSRRNDLWSPSIFASHFYLYPSLVVVVAKGKDKQPTLINDLLQPKCKTHPREILSEDTSLYLQESCNSLAVRVQRKGCKYRQVTTPYQVSRVLLKIQRTVLLKVPQPKSCTLAPDTGCHAKSIQHGYSCVPLIYMHQPNTTVT